MNPIQLSHIGLRLLAIYLVIQSIGNIPGAYATLSTISSMQEIDIFLSVSFISTLIVPLVFGVILWFITPRLSSFLISEKSDKEAFSIHQLQSSALSIIGVYLLAVTIPPAISVNYLLLQGSEVINNYNKSLSDIVINAITIDLKIVFALILVIGSNSISKAISNLRTTGTN